MLRALLDQNFDHRILYGLLRRIPGLNYLTAHEAGWNELDDNDLLIRAASEQRVLLTHGLRTMPGHIADVVASGHDVAGVFIVPRNFSFDQAINELEIIVTCSNETEWINSYRVLPL